MTEKKKLLETLLEMLMEETDRDSLSVSTPAQGGGIKVYVDFSKPKEALEKIKFAIDIRKQAKELINSEVED